MTDNELQDLAISCGAGIAQNPCNATMLCTFTPHELRTFYQAGLSARDAEVAFLTNSNKSLCALIKSEGSKVFDLEQQITQLQTKVAKLKNAAPMVDNMDVHDLREQITELRAEIAQKDEALELADEFVPIIDHRSSAEFVKIVDKINDALSTSTESASKWLADKIRERDQLFCESIIATQKDGRWDGMHGTRLVCDTAELLNYFNTHRPDKGEQS